MNNFPPELLLAIFLCVVGDVSLTDVEGKPWVSKAVSSALTSLGGVCKRWREILLDNSAFWSRIDVSNPQFAATCLGRYRSSRPQLHLTGVADNTDVLPPADVLGTLPQVTQRVQSIELVGDSDFLLGVWEALQWEGPQTTPIPIPVMLSQLTSLTVFGQGLSPTIIPCDLPLPELRTIELHDAVLELEHDCPNIEIAYFTFKNFDIATLVVFCDSLKHMSALVELEVLCDDSESGLDFHAYDDIEKVVLPHLRSLVLSGICVAYATLFSQTVQMPALSSGCIYLNTAEQLDAVLRSDDNLSAKRLRECSCDLSLTMHKDCGSFESDVMMLSTSGSPDCEDSHSYDDFVPLTHPANCHCISHGLYVSVICRSWLNDYDFQACGTIASRIVNVSISLDTLNALLVDTDVWSGFFKNVPNLKHIGIHHIDMASAEDIMLLQYMVSALNIRKLKEDSGTSMYCPKLQSVLMTYSRHPELADMDDGELVQTHDMYCAEQLLRARGRKNLQVVVDIKPEALERLVGTKEWWNVYTPLARRFGSSFEVKVYYGTDPKILDFE